MKKRTLGILELVILLLVVIVVAVFWMSSRDTDAPIESTSDPLGAIETLRSAGAFAHAYDAALAAMTEHPSDAIFAVEAGELALILRKPAQAGDHMRNAWELGARDLPVLLVMIDTLNGSSAEKISQFDALFPELPQTPENLNAKAKFYSRVGRNEEALELWKTLCNAKPREDIILQIARKLELMGRREGSLRFLQTQAEEGHLAAEGYNLLVSLLVFNNQFAEADQLAQTVSVDDPYGEWAFKKAMLTLSHGDISATAQALSLLTSARADHPVAYAVSHEARIRLALLRVILEGDEARLEDLSTLAIQEVRFLPTRTVTTPLLGLQASPKQIEGERLFYAFLQSAQKGETPSNARFMRLASLLPDSPAVIWLGIRHALSSGRAADAVSRYTEISTTHPLERIEGSAGLFYKSPLFVFEAARAFSANDRPREALTLINHLHERGVYTSSSIRLFTQLMKETGSSVDLSAMQEALARQFKEDPDIQLASVSQAYGQGQEDRALEILSPLIKQDVDNEDLQMVELMLMLNQGKIDQVLARCTTGNLSEKNKSLVQARAWLQKGEAQVAETFFKKALDPSADFYGYLDYARFLVDESRTVEASALYAEILEGQPNNLVALQGQAIIDELNGDSDAAIDGLRKILRTTPDDLYVQSRLAKVYLQKGKIRESLALANKVLARDPKNPDASFLQVMARVRMALDQPILTLRQRKLVEVGRKMEEVLVRSPENPQLLLRVYLASAYKEVGLPLEAKSLYADLLTLDASAWELSTLKRSDIQQALEALNE